MVFQVIVSEHQHYRRLNQEQMLSLKYSMIKAKPLKIYTPANDDEWLSAELLVVHKCSEFQRLQ